MVFHRVLLDQDSDNLKTISDEFTFEGPFRQPHSTRAKYTHSSIQLGGPMVSVHTAPSKSTLNIIVDLPKNKIENSLQEVMFWICGI